MRHPILVRVPVPDLVSKLTNFHRHNHSVSAPSQPGPVPRLLPWLTRRCLGRLLFLLAVAPARHLFLPSASLTTVTTLC